MVKTSNFSAVVLDCVPNARRKFYARGFELPKVYLSVIEALRKRNVDEYDYEYFLDQVLFESLSLSYPWQPSVRKLLTFDQKSTYLSKLEKSYPDHSKNLSLDPNFDLFVKTKPDVWMEYLKKFRAQKLLEFERCSELISEAVGKSSSKSIIDMLVLIAELQGFKPKRKVRASDTNLEFDSFMDHPIYVAAKIVDVPGMKLRGNVMVQYLFDSRLNNPVGLDNFVPGGSLYSEWNKDVQKILFSFYVQLIFLNDFRDSLEVC
jgi:hypothetical protein